jgi:uncharacterized Zn finger protein (UPF0148 family)
MSDFDKEAERERLREKYEHDEQKREVTERMSELLLKGATMTNAHCQDCGDPIFRYDGQEFCATCQKAVQRDTGDAEDESADEPTDAESGDEGAATNGDREEIHVAEPDETPVQFGGDEPADEEPDAGVADAPTDGTAVETPETDVAPSQSAPTHQPPQTSQPQSVDPGEYGALAAAAAALSRDVTRLARQAEAADDLGQKRALLEATEEAADALSAVQDAAR